MIRLFLSHSSKDLALVEALVDLVRSALNLRSDTIRCTSLDGYRLPGGANTQEHLRAEVQNAELLLGVISSASVDSVYVIFELGARWGAKKPLLPLLAPGASPGLLEGPLAGLNALRLDSASQIQQLVRELASCLKMRQQPPASYQKHIDAILAMARSETNKESSPKDSRRQSASVSGRAKQLFLGGCGVGNKLTIAPLGPGSDTSDLDDFIACLNKTGLFENKDLRGILQVRRLKQVEDTPNNRSEKEAMIETYFDNMNIIPDIVAAHTTVEEHAWFKLGKLLFDVPTLMSVGAKSDEIHSVLLAIELTLDRLSLGEALKNELLRYTAAVRKGMKVEAAIQKTNELGRAIQLAL